jgi:hypothetical protein
MRLKCQALETGPVKPLPTAAQFSSTSNIELFSRPRRIDQNFMFAIALMQHSSRDRG